MLNEYEEENEEEEDISDSGIPNDGDDVVKFKRKVLYREYECQCFHIKNFKLHLHFLLLLGARGNHNRR